VIGDERGLLRIGKDLHDQPLVSGEDNAILKVAIANLAKILQQPKHIRLVHNHARVYQTGCEGA
jgi:hypothetical protein